MKDAIKTTLVTALLVTIGWSTEVSAQEVEGKVIQDYARLMGETFEKQEAFNADLSTKRKTLLDDVDMYSKAIDNSQDGIEKLENQTELTARLVDLNRIDMEQVTTTVDTCIRAYQLTQQAGVYLKKGSQQSEAIKKQLERNSQLLTQVIPVVNSLQFTADPQRKEELKKSLIMLAEYQEMAERSQLNTPGQIDHMMRQFEDTISKLKIVQEMLTMERSALIIATHGQLVAAAQKRLEAFVGGGNFNDVAINMTQTISGRREPIKKIVPDFGSASPDTKLELSTKWSDLENKYVK